MTILIEEQRTNYLTNSDNPKRQHFDKSLGTLCVSYRSGFCFATRHPIWKFWYWRYVKSSTLVQAPFTLVGIRARYVQLEDGKFPTSYIATGNVPTTRAASSYNYSLKEMFQETRND